jgi:hypothetical protein
VRQPIPRAWWAWIQRTGFYTFDPEHGQNTDVTSIPNSRAALFCVSHLGSATLRFITSIEQQQFEGRP